MTFPAIPLLPGEEEKKKKKIHHSEILWDGSKSPPPPYLRGKIFKGCNFKNYLVFIGRITKFGNKLVQE